MTSTFINLKVNYHCSLWPNRVYPTPWNIPSLSRTTCCAFFSFTALAFLLCWWYTSWEGNGTPFQYSCLEKSHERRSLEGCSPWGREESVTTERLHFHFHTLEKEMATYSSVLAWRIPWTEEPGGVLESDTTERLHFYFSLLCIGEGNGNPLQCSCLENPRDGGAWWAAVYGAAQSRTRLKRLSSSSSSSSSSIPLCLSVCISFLICIQEWNRWVIW